MNMTAMKSGFARLAAVALVLVLAVSLCSVAAFAYTRVDPDRETSLTAYYTDDSGAAISGVTFRLYRVAEVSDAVVMTLTEDFAGSGVELSGVEESSTWNTLATTLYAYAAANGIEAAATGTADESGAVVFSGLSTGLYLLAGESKIIGETLYTPSLSLVLLPTLDETTDEWDYDPAVTVKYETKELQEYTTVTVKKLWDDDDYSGRPDSVTVALARDGEVIGTVTLSADNGWQYTWTELPVISDVAAGTAYTYTVSETDVPDGYKAAVDQSGRVYTITNSYTPPETPAPTGTPGPTTPVAPVEPTESPEATATPVPSTSGGSPTLPQTGQLNWPVPVMVTAGLLLLLLGYGLRSGKKERPYER